MELDEVPTGLIGPTRPFADPFIHRRNRSSLGNIAAVVESGGAPRR